MENKKREFIETRKGKVIINKAGGNASKNAMKYTLTLPNAWANNLKVEYWDRDIELIYDIQEREVIIKKIEKTEEEKEQAFLEYMEKKKNQ
ncbi:hypothetical protein [Gemelliphila palaticanis]|uniref:AbrB/MazE/SpoVT family DNA-binding domain-containing protein n=1 Tax=Gemelliphila palaticanis TaxID=81950 RepID=A0ABX2T3I3_9BACL|nr:hypothetical protein [Gemella palaticanis]MBF0716079.1 hypothetical protein [Gemella palaticanis]NYS48009.1 hypothetical protein [Gemella palaticanis]